MNIKALFKSKILIITVSVSIAILMAILSIFFIIKFLPKKMENADLSINSDVISIPEMLSSQTDTFAPTDSSAQVEVPLKISSPSSNDTTVTEDHITFFGSSDPAFPLTVNGEEVKRDASGAFALEKQLSIGSNYFKFSHKDIEQTYTVRYKYILVKSFSPEGDKSYASGADFAVTVQARTGSKITATFNGKTITLKETVNQNETETPQSDAFANFTGRFTLPSDNARDLNLGKVTIIAQKGSNKETKYSGNIICKKAEIPVIAEIVTYSAETFNGNTVDDMSRPTNNYFPKGTVDYVVGRSYNNGKEYLKLRCGRRVYVSKKNADSIVPVTKEYAGKLPDTNSVSFESCDVSKNSTVITLNTQWKAPFLLDLLPQSYYNPNYQDYRVSSVTAKYVEITFCYAKEIKGKIDLGKFNPIFSSYEIIKSESNYKLRLNFRKVGSFYGWDATYNSKGQLVFTFLHPAQVKAANNKYGADLSGARVMIDVGHGGKDPGAIGIGNLLEKERNLALAYALKSELEGIGATVIMNRNGDTTLNPDERCKHLIATKPDLCIAIHHDASTSSITNGFGAFNSTLFSHNAAKYIYNATISKNIYNASAKNNRNRFEWHYYFLARVTVCPVILTESGFITAWADYSGIKSSSINKIKAEAMCKGIADYFLSVRHNLPFEENMSSEVNSSSSGSSSSLSNNSSSATSSSVNSSSISSSFVNSSTLSSSSVDSTSSSSSSDISSLLSSSSDDSSLLSSSSDDSSSTIDSSSSDESILENSSEISSEEEEVSSNLDSSENTTTELN